MPSKTAGSPKSKASALAQPPVTKSTAKASPSRETATGKTSSSSAASTKAEPKAAAAAKDKKAPAKVAATRSPAKLAPKATAVKAAAPAAKAAASAKAPPAKETASKETSATLAKEAPAREAPAREAVKAVKKTSYDKDSLGTIRKRLMEQREELQNQLAAIEESATGLSQSEMSGEVSYDEDFADAGSFTFEREKEFSIANNVTDLRSKTDRALHRIEEGRYGICESCGQPIESARLKALPHVTLCLKCKKAEERR